MTQTANCPILYDLKNQPKVRVDFSLNNEKKNDYLSILIARLFISTNVHSSHAQYGLAFDQFVIDQSKLQAISDQKP